ncbi:leucine-rich repeat extensin-like protein 5 [Ricinus communis]|uniref:leucine-rich repeat extensin-like protein 5 n=1 Tax=Ricinus communis TaxID=3988 RepID=UPI00201AE9B7|nr:leucine-rich repeat extensin-like protein 5 [Ricinus communis]
MANQPSQSRPWSRLYSIARPAPPESIPTPPAAPESAPGQPRAVLARPSLRPVPQPTLPTRPQEPTQAPQPPVATVPPPVAAPPPATPTQRSPAKPSGGGGVASVPSSPVLRASVPTASLPKSPVQTATAVGPVTTSSSVQSSPRPRVSAPTSSLPSSPVLKPTQTFSVPTSPATKPMPTTVSLPTSPATKPMPTTVSVPTSPATKPMPTTVSVPTSPLPKPAPATSSVPTSPANRAVSTTTTATSTARVPSPVQYPRTINPVVQSPPRSPKLNPTAPPPSPLILPPAKIKSDAETEAKIPLVAEQKTVVVQKTIDKPKPWLTNGGNSERDLVNAVKSSIGLNGKQETTKDHGETKEKVLHKKIFSGSEDGGMRVITVAGENKGAFMEVIRSPNKKHVFEGSPHHLHKKDNDPKSDGIKWISYSSNGSSSEGEGKPKMKDKNHKGKGMNSLPMTAFMNSNVQGVNNSIVYNSSCTHHDPGVHLALSRKSAGGGFHVKDRSNGH